MLLTLVFPLLLLGGMAIAAQSSIHGTLSLRMDVITTAWLANVVASVILLLMVVFFEPPQAATMFSVPRIGTAATIVAIIAGQIVMGLMVDHFG